jgi:hypothetical protein
MSDAARWVVAVVIAAAIVALLLLGRGEEQRGQPVGSPTAAIIERVA